jgi:hypothetical protein
MIPLLIKVKEKLQLLACFSDYWKNKLNKKVFACVGLFDPYCFRKPRAWLIVTI